MKYKLQHVVICFTRNAGMSLTALIIITMIFGSLHTDHLGSTCIDSGAGAGVV